MSKRGYISRYFLIIKKLKAHPYCSYEKLKEYMVNQVEYLQLNDDTLTIGFSKRTLQRDFREIRNTFGVDIEYSTSEKGYFIRDTTSMNMNFERMVEAFDMFNSLNLSQDLKPFVQLENRKPLGSDHLFGLIHAMKNNTRVSFSYQKYYDEKETKRYVEPYFLKEFKNRWYLIAKDLKDSATKSFALDRMTGLNINDNQFSKVDIKSIQNDYRNCFGIIKPSDKKPQEIVLSFDPFFAKYIKSLPLHQSQQILIDNPSELQIMITVYITEDLIMELLSYGENIKVLKPDLLVKELKRIYSEAQDQY